MSKPIKSPYNHLLTEKRISRKKLEVIADMLGIDQLVVIAQSGNSDDEIQVAGINYPPAELKIVLRKLLHALPDEAEGNYGGEFPLKN